MSSVGSSDSRRRVHFPTSPVTRLHKYDQNSIIARTPSPLRGNLVEDDSDESASEAGPSTPPSTGFAQLPMPTPYSKSTALPTSSTTHPFLEIDPYTGAAALLSWDVRLPPSTATVRQKGDKYKHRRSPLPNESLEPSELALPATYPPTSRMHLSIPQIPWKPLAVTSQSARGGLVTFSDFLSAVYASLQSLIRSEEYASFPKEMQDRIASAFYSRCERVGQSRVEERLGRKFDRSNREDVEESERESKEEQKKGLKRVDGLLSCTQFFGLASDFQANGGAWVLTLAPPSP